MTLPPLHHLAALVDGEAYLHSVIVGSDVITCSPVGTIRLTNAGHITKLGTLSDGMDAIAAAYFRATSRVPGVDPYDLAASA